MIALCLSEEGIPPTADDRFAVAQKLHDLCTGAGLPAEDVWVDPLVLSVSADPCAPTVTMDTLKLVKDRLPVRTTGGLSNVSFGLPNRPLLNRTFVAMCAGLGIDGLIVDVRNQQMMAAIKAIEASAARTTSAAATSRRTAPASWSKPWYSRPGRERVDLGIAVGELPAGPLNAITDVPGVLVGHCTVRGAGPICRAAAGPPARASPPSSRTATTSGTSVSSPAPSPPTAWANSWASARSASGGSSSRPSCSPTRRASAPCTTPPSAG